VLPPQGLVASEPCTPRSAVVDHRWKEIGCLRPRAAVGRIVVSPKAAHCRVNSESRARYERSPSVRGSVEVASYKKLYRGIRNRLLEM
jgi:hypothetical protein